MGFLCDRAGARGFLLGAVLAVVAAVGVALTAPSKPALDAGKAGE